MQWVALGTIRVGGWALKELVGDWHVKGNLGVLEGGMGAP